MPDFDGDGRDDILWRNFDTGVVSNWLGTESGGWLINDANALDPWAHGHLAAVGDFNGDGRDDTLWRDNEEIFLGLTDPGGAHYFYWNLGFVVEVPDTWQVIGAGDFDGDGRDDILWGSNDGRISNWLSNGDSTFTINDANAMHTIGDWTVQAIGDFDNDGRDDVIIRSPGGAVDLLWGWDNGGWFREDPFAQVSTDWRIVGAGDFNGDGFDDILWRNIDGTVSNWLSGAFAGYPAFTINDANAWAAVPVDWQIVGIGDYNGDGHDDILWRNSSGAISNWLGTETGGWVINDANAMVAVPNEWVVQPASSGAGDWDY